MVEIGIISDTHGDIAGTRTAACIFREYRVQAVFHCGDIGGFDVLTELASVFQPLEVPVYVVYGNMDVYSDDWKFFPTNIGILLLGRFGEVELAGRKIAFLHGDDSIQLRRALQSGEYDYIFTGHTHAFHNYREGGTRCINPGSAGHGSPATAAMLNLTTDVMEVVTL